MGSRASSPEWVPYVLSEMILTEVKLDNLYEAVTPPIRFGARSESSSHFL
jgi:hypothetical protein